MKVLALDIASGGVTAALFNDSLEAERLAEIPWVLVTDSSGAATLSVDTLVISVRQALSAISANVHVDAISITAFMHSCVLLDGDDQPLTPIFTWMDRRGESGVASLRDRFGADFHARTGCRFHPMFPVFKLVWLRSEHGELVGRARRIVSAKALVLHLLTGHWHEDHGTASASGMYNASMGAWDPDILETLDLDSALLPPVESRTAFAGPASTRVVVGSGDGFMANLGSGCGSSRRLSATLGTSGSVRQVLSSPVLDESAGTFCYMGDVDEFLLGCATSNGGNVLDWARLVLGSRGGGTRNDLPIFLPFLHGERSPDWNPELRANWHDVAAHHTAGDLSMAAMEGVCFNLADYVDIVVRASGQRPEALVLSGNAFLDGEVARTFASLVDLQVVIPADPGMASLRGAAACGFTALGRNVSAALEAVVENSVVVAPMADPNLRRRHQRFRDIRYS